MIRRGMLGLASRGKLSILIFHRVLRAPDPLLPGEPSADELDALLAHVKSTFNVLPLADAVAHLATGRLPSRALAITFDDGYADNLTLAAPVLRRHGLPATVFVATGYLDGRCMFNDRVIEAVRATRSAQLELADIGLGTHAIDSIASRLKAIDAMLAELKRLPPDVRDDRVAAIERRMHVAPAAGLMLDRDALRELARGGLDIGAHTVTHPILATTPDADARREIEDSKRELEAVIGHSVALFAYPNGKPQQDYTARHVAMVREAGFAAAVSTAWGAADRSADRYQLPRFTPWKREPLGFDLLLARNLRQPARYAA